MTEQVTVIPIKKDFKMELTTHKTKIVYNEDEFYKCERIKKLLNDSDVGSFITESLGLSDSDTNYFERFLTKYDFDNVIKALKDIRKNVEQRKTYKNYDAMKTLTDKLLTVSNLRYIKDNIYPGDFDFKDDDEEDSEEDEES